MSTQWITDRLPTKQEAVSGNVISCRWGHINLLQWYKIEAGEPWMSIPKPEMYVKPKRWTVEFDTGWDTWSINDNHRKLQHSFVLNGLKIDQGDVAQQIEDLFNEVMP